MIQLTNEPIDAAALIDAARHPRAGAVVLFLGTTRELTAGRRTVALDYEAYREMAERKLAELESEACRRWPVIECIMVHRLGRVPPAEASVAIFVATPHRRDAFAAGEWLIDSLHAARTAAQWTDELDALIHAHAKPGHDNYTAVVLWVLREDEQSTQLLDDLGPVDSR